MLLERLVILHDFFQAKCWELNAIFHFLKGRTSVDIFGTKSVKLLLALSIKSLKIEMLCIY